MRTLQLSIALLLCLAFAGCSKQFMCHLNGTSCPASNAPQTSGGGDPNEGAAASEESAPAESSSSSTETSTAEASSAPAPRDCLPAGAKVKESDYHRCCCDCYRTQVEPVPGMVTCN